MSKEYNQIVNLYKFNINFSKYADNKLMDMSPDYILEKGNSENMKVILREMKLRTLV
jgi:hypothetical protein